jgi:hypothetical protein
VKRLHSIFLGSLFWSALATAGPEEEMFASGTRLCRDGDFTQAATVLRGAARARPASGTLQNLGLAEWHRGQIGPAVLAWEQAVWVDPFNQAARSNLAFARKISQLDDANLAWQEVVSSWLPANWWAYLTGMGIWMGLGALGVPAVLGRRKTMWQQLVGGIGLMLIVLGIPALIGIHTRANIGFVLKKDAELKLTPTQEGQVVSRLAPGEPVRMIRRKGPFILVGTPRGKGWLQTDHFGLISSLND